MVDFSKLRKMTNLENLNKAVGDIVQKKTFEEDTRYWKLQMDKAGNGFAVIRFLPAPEKDGDDGLPFVKYFDHGFQGPTGKWYIEKSLTSIGQDDPLSKLNSEMWNTGNKDDQEVVRSRKRRLHFVSNILVIKDPKEPENEGKVFLFVYGKKIFDKIQRAMNPELTEEEVAAGETPPDPFVPFDPWEGANFKLKSKKVDGQINYDQSVFTDQTPISKDDEYIGKIWESTHSLKEVIDPKNFKSYEDLEKRLKFVLGEVVAPKEVVESKKSASKSSNVEKMKSVMESLDADEDDDTMKYFSNMIDEN